MKTLLTTFVLLFSLSSLAQTKPDIRPEIEAQAQSVFTAANSKVATNQLVCFEFGKLIGLGMAYKAVQPGAPLENFINETVALYSANCKGRKLEKSERAEISQLAESIFTEIKN